MKDFFTVIGVLAAVAFITGAIIPGVSFHAYWGSSKGAQKWHADRAAAKEEA